jgi:hypothetical protein
VQGLNTVKHPKKQYQSKNKEKRKDPTTAVAPQPYKAESKKKNQQGPNQQEITKRLNYTPRAPKHKPEANKQNQQPRNQ